MGKQEMKDSFNIDDVLKKVKKRKKQMKLEKEAEKRLQSKNTVKHISL